MSIGRTIMAVAAFLLLGASVQAATGDRIVAVVNGEIITLSELNRAFEPYEERLDKTFQGSERERNKVKEETRQTLLNRMVDNQLMEQESRKTGINVRNEDVEAAVQDIQRRRNLSPEEFRRTLDRDGMTLEGLRKDMRNHMMRMRLVQRDIKSRVVTTDEEIGEYYRRHRADYEGKEAVRVQQILLVPPRGADEAARAKVRAEIFQLRARIVAGEPFEKLAAAFSQGPAAAEGGDIGFIEKGVILPEVEDAAFSLPVGQISPVIESSVGFHLIMVTDRRGAGLKPIEVVREEIREKIDQEKIEKKFGEWMEELRKRSHVEIKL